MTTQERVWRITNDDFEQRQKILTADERFCSLVATATSLDQAADILAHESLAQYRRGARIIDLTTFVLYSRIGINPLETIETVPYITRIDQVAGHYAWKLRDDVAARLELEPLRIQDNGQYANDNFPDKAGFHSRLTFSPQLLESAVRTPGIC